MTAPDIRLPAIGLPPGDNPSPVWFDYATSLDRAVGKASKPGAPPGLEVIDPTGRCWRLAVQSKPGSDPPVEADLIPASEVSLEALKARLCAWLDFDPGAVWDEDPRTGNPIDLPARVALIKGRLNRAKTHEQLIRRSRNAVT